MKTGRLTVLTVLIAALACGDADPVTIGEDAVPVRIELNRTTLGLVQGDTFRLNLVLVSSDSTRTPESATSWASSNAAVAHIDRTGLLTARAAGQARITAYLDQDSAQALIIVQPAHTTRFVQIAAGGGHTCAIAQGGTAYCWGANNFGQIGATDLPSSATPIAVRGEPSLAAVAAGTRHSCAAIADGGVLCWGANSAGQLGIVDGGSKVNHQPVRSQATSVVTTVTVASGHGCALDDAGVLACWGLNTLGQLGRGELGVVHAPAPLETGVRFTMASAGQGHTCAITAEGVAWCWGGNESGQVGSASPDLCGNVPCVWTPTRVVTALRFSAISAGFAFTCGLTVSGESWCWGGNAEGQLGNGTTAASTAPTRVQGPPFVAIDAGDRHACGLTASGEVWCWGSNLNGELGRSGESSALPVRAGVPVLTRISAGSAHTCGLTPGGAAFCWGDPLLGRLGLNRQ